MKVEIYKSGILRKSWKWRLKARNGRIIAHGTGFNRVYECKESVDKVIEAMTEGIEINIL